MAIVRRAIWEVLRMNMSKNIDQKLAQYSKINFQNDLKNLENDVNNRIFAKQSAINVLKNIVEEWFGMPVRMGVGAIASTMILGIFLGTQLQTDISPVKQDLLGFDVFSASSAQLPSSLLAAKNE